MTIHRGELSQERLQLAFAAASPEAAKLFAVDGNAVVTNDNKVVIQLGLKDKDLKAPAFSAFKDKARSVKVVFPEGSLTVPAAGTRSDEPFGATDAYAQIAVNPNHHQNGGPHFGVFESLVAPLEKAI